jgi:hypothetical protein
MNREELMAKIASLEQRLDASEPRNTLASEIEALEQKIAAMDDDKDDEKKASLVDPSGIEEECNQDRFHTVERITHGEELTDADSMEAVGRKVGRSTTASVSMLKQASVRLDKVAEYLEKCGNTKLALQIDKIADAVDARINGGAR